MEGTPPEPDPAPPPRRGGPSRAVRILLGVVAAAVVIYVLVTVVFPWFQEYQDDPTLEGAPSPVVAAALR